jgi:hypothetical protein
MYLCIHAPQIQHQAAEALKKATGLKLISIMHPIYAVTSLKPSTKQLRALDKA